MLGSVEIGVAKRLVSLGERDLELVCLELSLHLIERAEAALTSVTSEAVRASARGRWPQRSQSSACARTMLA
jgi:hypothetical protein